MTDRRQPLNMSAALICKTTYCKASELMQLLEANTKAHDDFRLQNDREWRAKVDHLKAQLAAAQAAPALTISADMLEELRVAVNMAKAAADSKTLYMPREYAERLLAAAQAAPPPTAAPGEYDRMAQQLEDLAGMSDLANPLCREAAAAIRKLTAEKRAWQEHANWMEECRDAAEGRAAALEEALAVCLNKTPRGAEP